MRGFFSAVRKAAQGNCRPLDLRAFCYLLSADASPMAHLNDHYLKLKAGYLFPEIARRVKQFMEANPEKSKNVIRCGIGDVTEPLPGAAIEAMHRAVDELSRRESFRGYGPEQG